MQTNWSEKSINGHREPFVLGLTSQQGAAQAALSRNQGVLFESPVHIFHIAISYTLGGEVHIFHIAIS